MFLSRSYGYRSFYMMLRRNIDPEVFFIIDSRSIQGGEK